MILHNKIKSLKLLLLVVKTTHVSNHKIGKITLHCHLLLKITVGSKKPKMFIIVLVDLNHEETEETDVRIIST